MRHRSFFALQLAHARVECGTCSSPDISISKRIMGRVWPSLSAVFLLGTDVFSDSEKLTDTSVESKTKRNFGLIAFRSFRVQMLGPSIHI